MNASSRLFHACVPALLCAGLLFPPTCHAAGPATAHYVFVNRDRTRIHDAAFLATPAIAGAEIKYTWKELEPERDRYSFTHVLEDLTFLESHGKRLVIQLQDATFDERINVPAYLLAVTAFHGGAARKYEAPDVAVQDNDLAATDKLTHQPAVVPLLAAFAADSLHLDHVFWGLQEPYYSRDVLPWLRSQPAAEPARSR